MVVQVGGALLGFAVERISVGMQHVAAQASPVDKKTGLPQVQARLFQCLSLWHANPSFRACILGTFATRSLLSL